MTREENSRYKYLESRSKAGELLYPYDFKETMSIKEVLSFVENNKIVPETPLNEGVLKDLVVKTAGRVLAIRSIGKITFIKIESAGLSLQIIFKSKSKEIFRGDIIGVEGTIGFSMKGELSIVSTCVRVLAPCLHIYPTEHYGLKETELRYRQRYLDLVLNKTSLNRFVTRSKVISFVKRYLDSKDFMEVETPMMHIIPGGAAAKPFKTVLNEMDMELSLRISPELHLKTLLIGGIPRVYEMGRQFRNEGIDATHNPEFTTCEFYMSYADYNDVLEITEDMISSMVQEIFGTKLIEYRVEGNDGTVKDVSIDFNTPFKKIDILSELSKKVNIEITGEMLETDAGRDLLDKLCKENNIRCNNPRTTTRLLDKLVGEYLESDCNNPTFLMNHPKIMSPLAKEHRTQKNITERFELFILGKEVCNAYTELNDPFDQRRRFEQQAKDKTAGDDEAQEIDEDFCTAMEYALPPAGGWGLGIDRLVMMLTGAQNIRDVLFFPTMRPKKTTE
ncbi:lysyl-tRNA synthetase, class II [Nematocida minor]|uniref:lysyl-tRNA synthetase, class II n=1 Tax=Nematocida minor TaxID=1912983 RepID=UPI00221F84EA|nr:lysyl-tRNA synthetase, class II [Nematocida minor]KAI5190548.1 lysyl-tRNA synthetase, class II [Nematocida minor]